VRRNWQVPDWHVKRWLYLSDGLILATLVVLLQVTPASAGLVRSAMVLAVASGYVAIYMHQLYKGKLVPLNALGPRPR
jgi:hypothetical protein